MTFTLALTFVLGLASPASAQVYAPTTRIENAEVRGLDVIPSNFAEGFAAAKPETVFEPSTKMILVRFQTSKPPQVEKLFVTWTAVPETGVPVSLQRTPADTGALASGLVDALANGGNPLARGRYIVALVGPDEHLYRAVEFRVGAPPTTPSGPTAPARLEKVYFDQYSLTYPSTFTPQPVVVGMTGMFLRRTAPFGLMFAVLSDPGADAIVPQAREIIQVMLSRLESGGPPITNAEVSDIPADQLLPGMIVGKVMDVPLRRGDERARELLFKGRRRAQGPLRIRDDHGPWGPTTSF